MNLNTTNKEVPETYYGFIYKTTFPNGMIYVGQTTKRFYEKYFGSGKECLIQIKIFGVKNLKREILKFANSQKQLHNLEEIYIKRFDAVNNGYNISKKATFSSFGLKVSKETKEKISIANSGKKRSKEIRLQISLSNKGKPKSEEHKKNLSLARKGKSSWNKGIKHSIETKDKMSKASLGKKKSKNHKQNISKGHKGLKLSLKTIKKITYSNRVTAANKKKL